MEKMQEAESKQEGEPAGGREEQAAGQARGDGKDGGEHRAAGGQTGERAAGRERGDGRDGGALASVLEVADVTTGWLDVGIDQLGRNKLIPTISFRLENISDEQTRSLQLNSVFRRCQVVSEGQPAPVAPVSPADPIAGTCVAEDQEWGNAFVRAVGREGLAPGAGIGPFTMESGLGYTSEQPRREILQHRDFVDVKIELFVKHRSDQWAKLGEYQIERQLLTQ